MAKPKKGTLEYMVQAEGLHSITHVARALNVERSTLRNWFKKRPEVLQCALVGLAALEREPPRTARVWLEAYEAGKLDGMTEKGQNVERAREIIVEEIFQGREQARIVSRDEILGSARRATR